MIITECHQLTLQINPFMQWLNLAMEHLVSHVSTLIEDKIKQTSISIAAIADYVIPKNQAENVSCNTTNQAENQHPTKKKKKKYWKWNSEAEPELKFELQCGGDNWCDLLALRCRTAIVHRANPNPTIGHSNQKLARLNSKRQHKFDDYHTRNRKRVDWGANASNQTFLLQNEVEEPNEQIRTEAIVDWSRRKEKRERAETKRWNEGERRNRRNGEKSEMERWVNGEVSDGEVSDGEVSDGEVSDLRRPKGERRKERREWDAEKDASLVWRRETRA